MSRAKKIFLSYRSLKRMASDKWGDMSVWAGLGYGLKLTAWVAEAAKNTHIECHGTNGHAKEPSN
jgi:hypothetical protein